MRVRQDWHVILASILISVSLHCYVVTTQASASVTTTLWDSADLEILDISTVDVIKFRRRPILKSYWPETPNFRVCSSSRVSKARMHYAVSVWEKLGYTVGDVYFDNDSQICRQGGLYGEITVMLITSDIPVGDNIAVTRNWHRKDNHEILKSQIYVIGGYSQRPRLLEHEIGHALGWAHFNQRLHIMNSNYPDTGLDSFGVMRGDYEKERNRLQNIDFK